MGVQARKPNQKGLALGNSKGFTLIEIVLVLAIAGLIFVIVFLAVQGAQRARRDTERKTAVARMVAAAELLASSEKGQYNDDGGNTLNCDDLTGGSNPAWNDGGFNCANYSSGTVGSQLAADDFETIIFAPKRECDGSANNRQVCGAVRLESGGGLFQQGND